MPKCHRNIGLNKFEQIANPESIKLGYYITVYGNVKGNGNIENPGIYLNFKEVELIAYGEEIISGPSTSEIFSKRHTILPKGAIPLNHSLSENKDVKMPKIPKESNIDLNLDILDKF